ncbi:benenodin family lasso peptide [Asticcacaulis sp.]|jgi:hypothetical protein|nr:benenodin family lasso peptide [Asticcacaulis sp.]HTM81902.1 benenodin family lasso peptide [Asticcacaulis sp.]
MTKFDRESEDVIDLGDATIETKGGTQFDPPDGVQLQRKPIPGLSAD